MNRTIRNSALAASALIALPAVAACGSGDAATHDTLTFAATPAESSQSLQSDFANIIELLEQEAGVSIEFQNASDYAAVIEGQRAGQIDMASYGPFSYVIAKDSGVDIEAVVAPTNDKDVAPAYTSLAYVRADSDIDSLDDIDGQEVCFVDAASTSGYLVPMKGLMDAGKSMDDDMQQVLAGGHDASLLSLESGNCDVAFAHDAMLDTLVASGQLEDGALRSIWKSDPIPEDPIAVSNSIDPEVIERITTVLREKANKPALVEAGICDSEDDCVLPELIEYGYLPVTDEDFDSIRELCEETKADACNSVG